MSAPFFRQVLRQAVAPRTAAAVPVTAARPFLATPFLRRAYSTEGDAAAADAALETPAGSLIEPPFLQTLRQDLKAAMRAKDQTRLDVIRGLITDTVNSQKTAMPIETDIHLLRLMRRTRLRQADAAAEFMTAGRKDLAERELSQMGIIRQYELATGIVTASREELQKIVAGVLADASTRPNYAGPLKMREIIEKSQAELKNRDFLRSDLVTEVNMQIKDFNKQRRV